MRYRFFLSDTYGGRILFSSGEVRFSSMALLEREYSETLFSSIRKPTDYPLRNGFRIPELAQILPRFAGFLFRAAASSVRCSTVTR